MKRKNKAIKETAPFLEAEFGREHSQRILEAAWKEYEAICSANAAESRAVKRHTVEDIYPCISLYRALVQDGLHKTEAYGFLDRTWSKRAEKKAKSMQMLCKLPGIYRKMPGIFAWVAKNQFGVKAGFQAHFYPTPSTRCKFDMTKCLYCEICKQNGCPELVPCFCHTDDVTDGHIHPKLLWNRTKTMGEGADVCDFDLIVMESGKKNP